MSAMKKQTTDYASLLGVTPVCRVSDEEIISTLLTPQVRAFLGELQEPTVSVKETVKGLFDGDEATNYNDHRLYGGQAGFVRYPYIVSLYPSQYGALVIKRDGIKFKISAWHGDLRKGNLDLIFKVALRDRRFDGTSRVNDYALIDFPGYNLEEFNHPLRIDGMPENASSVELSVYGFMPGSRIVDAVGDQELDRFVGNPFEFVGEPEKFLRLFNQAWSSKRSPGQNGNPVPDVSRIVGLAVEKLALLAGYDYIENASSHFHVAKWAESIGYKYADPKQGETLARLTAGVKNLLASGKSLTRQQQSWLCVLQSLPKEHIPSDLYLGGPVWPQDNIGPVNLWMYKPLSERAKNGTSPDASR